MSKNVAYGGILLAINIIILLLINIVPTNTLFLMALASLPLSIIIMEFGPKYGIIFYIGSVILSFLIMSNKLHWITYVSTFGVYGIVKYLVEQDRHIVLEVILKLIFANIIVFLLYYFLKAFIFLPINVITILGFQVVFLVYDYAYSSFIDYYNTRMKKLIK